MRKNIIITIKKVIIKIIKINIKQMIRYNFYYQIKEHGAKEIFAVKHCVRPKATKVYKHLIKLLEKKKVYSIEYNTTQNNE